MNDLKNAIEVIKNYNAMSIDEFVILLEEYLGRSIAQDERALVEFVGLFNTDLFQICTKKDG